MKKTFLTTTSLAMCLALFSPIHAKPSKHKFTISFTGSSYQYYEPMKDRPNNGMSMKGSMFGGGLQYAYSPIDQWFLVKVNTRLTGGKFIYRGHTQVTLSPAMIKDISHMLSESRILVGAKFNLFENLSTEFLTGFGYRFKSDNKLNVADSKRKSHYMYMPFIMNNTYRVSDRFSISTELEFDYFLSGTQYTYPTKSLNALNQLLEGKDLKPCKNKQKKGYGLKATLMFNKLKEGEEEYSFGPYIDYWHVNKSRPAMIIPRLSIEGVEPKNHTVEYGLKLSIHF